MTTPKPTPDSPWNTAVLIFDGVEVLDFAGPYEVFSRTRLVAGAESRRTDDSAPFQVFTVAASEARVHATGGLQVTPDYSFETVPKIDLLVVPGGFGTRPLLQDESLLEWLRKTSATAQKITSVCTGSLLLTRAGLLAGRRATTHWLALDELERLGDGGVSVARDERFVDDGVVTSAGVSAGIDMAFHVVEDTCGKEVADETARYIEYPRP